MVMDGDDQNIGGDVTDTPLADDEGGQAPEPTAGPIPEPTSGEEPTTEPAGEVPPLPPVPESTSDTGPAPSGDENNPAS